jgi:hypothetical protein
MQGTQVLGSAGVSPALFLASAQRKNCRRDADATKIERHVFQVEFLSGNAG